jgi:DNA-directed RNA polymerase specialized sigma24 family protein
MRLWFKRQRLNSAGTPPTSGNADELLTRHQNQDSDDLRGDPLEAEHRLLVTLVLMSDIDQLSWEIYAAARSGYTYPEIADKWGVTVFTVKKCVARALLEIMKSKL